MWALLVIGVLLLMIAPLASYCLGRDEDYSDKVGQAAPAQANQPSAVVTGPLIR